MSIFFGNNTILSVFLRKKSDKFIIFAFVKEDANDSIKENKTGRLGVPE